MMEAMTTIEGDIERRRQSRMVQIGQRLKAARTSARLSQLVIAEACAVTSQSVSNWEKGEFLIDDERLEKAATRLGVDVEWLRTGKGTPPSIRLVDTDRGKAVYAPLITIGAAIPEMKNGVGSGAEYSKKAAVHSYWNLPPSQTENLGVDPKNLKAFRVLTDNLAPDIAEGSTVFVDFGQTRPVDGGVFAIDNGLSIILKCMHVDGSQAATIALSDHHSKGKEVVKKGKLKILGRVVAVFYPLNVVSRK